MSNSILPNVQLFRSSDYVEICHNVFSVAFPYISSGKDKLMTEGAAEFTLSLLNKLKLCLSDGIDNKRGDKLLLEIEESLFVSKGRIKIPNYGKSNNLCQLIWLAETCVYLVKGELKKYNLPISAEDEKRNQGYDEILSLILERFKILDIHPYSGKQPDYVLYGSNQ